MIYVECTPDATLLKTLGIKRKEILHEGGKAKVCRRLEKKEGCKGLIDEDPNSVQPPYLKRISIEKLSNGVKTGEDNINNNTVIILSPRLEEWIIEAAREAKVDIKKHNLSDNPDELHKIINANVDKFEELIGDLRTKSKRMKVLSDLLHRS